MMAVMDVQITMLGNGIVEVVPNGSLDENTLDALRPYLFDRSESILLDLSEVSRIDAAAMAMVMLARIEIEATGRALVVQSSRSRVARTLERAGLPRFVTVADERIDALRAIRGFGAVAA
jgi:anti-anti-sigma factor